MAHSLLLLLMMMVMVNVDEFLLNIHTVCTLINGFSFATTF
jgi:hypothetical protein